MSADDRNGAAIGSGAARTADSRDAGPRPHQAGNFGDPRLPDRFWSKVIPEPNSGCWLWIGAACPKGYGTAKSDGRTVKVHRLAYTTLVCAVPDGLHLDHLCRTRCCVNPAHLEAVSPLENQRRGLRGDLTTHCPKGHPYSGRNLMRNHRSRLCRACIYESNARRRELLRGALLPLAEVDVEEVNRLLKEAS